MEDARGDLDVLAGLVNGTYSWMMPIAHEVLDADLHSVIGLTR
jgi:hypothetical protein